MGVVGDRLPVGAELMYGARAVSLLDTDELQVRAISVPKEELVYVRSLLEASEGLGFFIAKSGGELLLVCPVSQSRQLDQFVSDLSQEVPLVHRTLDVDHGAYDVVG